MKKRILAAMSGGIDSSIAAFLLKQEGWDVEGVHFAMGGQGLEDSRRLCSEIAGWLGIKMRFVDLQKEFRRDVIGAILNEYKSGRTPNPCVICNRQVKFKALVRIAEDLEIDHVATGHYARKIKKRLPADGTKKDWEWFILKAKDKTKDQSYFLSQLKTDTIERCEFPLGEYLKKEVRELARQHGFPGASKKESQGLCFVSGTVEDFIKSHVQECGGEIFDQAGNAIGEHRGLSLYTIGQRKGIGVGRSGPYYVVSKDYNANALHVSNVGDESRLYRDGIRLNAGEWVNERRYALFMAKQDKMIEEGKLMIKIRYGHLEELITAMQIDPQGIIKVKLKRKIRAITSGQAAVFYDSKGVVWLGSSII